MNGRQDQIDLWFDCRRRWEMKLDTGSGVVLFDTRVMLGLVLVLVLVLVLIVGCWLSGWSSLIVEL